MKISVIIPIYNTEIYLKRCIESVLNQTYVEFELILINDGSTDNSEKICLEFLKLDKRIIYQSYKNSGVSRSRNRGLDLATGEYVCFIDSDDWVNENYLKDFLDYLEYEQYTTLIVQDINRFNSDDSISKNIQDYNNEIIKIPHELDKLISNYKFTQGYISNKLYNNTIIKKHKIRFNEKMNCNEDELFYLQYIQYLEKIIFINKANYNYIDRIDSLTKSKPSFTSSINHFIGTMDFINFLRNTKIIETETYCSKIYSINFDFLLRSVLFGNSYSLSLRIKYLKEMHNLLRKYFFLYKPSSILKKIDFYLFKYKLFYVLNFVILIKNKFNS